jgi:type III secretion system YscD/HrpQ family protein
MAVEFIAEEGVLKGLILSLENGKEWTIGRDPDLCTIVIEDPQASRIHVRIRKTDVGFTIENVSDTTPTLLGGVPITIPTVLQADDLVTIGTSVFRFYPEGAPAEYVFEFEHPPFEEPSPEEPLEVSDQEEISEEEVLEEQKSSFEEEQPKEEEVHLEEPHEAIFEEAEVPQLHIDLMQTSRYILKVIAGPNTGAEFVLDMERSYLIGTDTTSCDIVFNDLSVSREHARLSISQEGVVSIQDLGSRNGVIVDKERVIGAKTLSANAVVGLGTSAFLLIDREAPSETIVAPVFEGAFEEEEEVPPPSEEVVEEMPEPAVVKTAAKPTLSPGTLVLALIIGGMAVLLGIGLVSLFQTTEVAIARKDYVAELQAILRRYPAVRYTYNPTTSKLFLLGHVSNGVEHNELRYQLGGLAFLKGVDDNIVNDEAIWQEMNILLSKHVDFKGVSMHSPAPGSFVISGYLQTAKQASNLMDYLNVNFNYLDLLQNNVVVEESVLEDVSTNLTQQGFAAVAPSLSNGDLQLTGYIASNNLFAFEKFVEELKKKKGIRSVRNFVVTVTPEQGIIDLNRKHQAIFDVTAAYLERPLRYHVTGYSKHGDVNVNVVINGKILTRGDCLDGYTITGIQPHAIFLERDGLKYKIEYNTCNAYREE